MLARMPRTIDPPEPPLHDGDLLLRPWRESDADAVAAACRDPEIARWVPVPVPYRLEDALDFIRSNRMAWREGIGAAFAVVDAASDRLLGAITLHRAREREAFVGYWVAPEARGRGVATRALRLVARWAFATLPLVRLSLYRDVGNEASGRTAEKAGFVREGVLRSYADHRGEPRDCVMYSLIRSDAVVAAGAQAASEAVLPDAGAAEAAAP